MLCYDVYKLKGRRQINGKKKFTFTWFIFKIAASAVVGASAASAGGTWVSYTHSGIPTFGGTSYNTTKLNKKVTVSTSGSMMATSTLPALGTYGRLISTQKRDRSDAISLTKHKQAMKTSADKGESVGDKVSSSALEFNKTKVTVKFSPDNLT